MVLYSLVYSLTLLGPHTKAFTFIGSGVEVRERGLIFQGRLIPGVNIESYAWEVSNRFPMEAMRLNVRRLFKFRGQPGIPIPWEHHAEVDALMKRHFSAWPE